MPLLNYYGRHQRLNAIKNTIVCRCQTFLPSAGESILFGSEVRKRRTSRLPRGRKEHGGGGTRKGGRSFPKDFFPSKRKGKRGPFLAAAMSTIFVTGG
jgi:hypothetical protein